MVIYKFVSMVQHWTPDNFQWDEHFIENVSLWPNTYDSNWLTQRSNDDTLRKNVYLDQHISDKPEN